MIVLVCGGRHYGREKAEQDLLRLTLSRLHHRRPFSRLLHGGCSGADALAGYWAAERGVLVREFRADWRKYGKSAGPRRNERMLTEGRPQLVVAFSGGAGTADMIRRARALGVQVVEVHGDVMRSVTVQDG